MRFTKTAQLSLFSFWFSSSVLAHLLQGQYNAEISSVSDQYVFQSAGALHIHAHKSFTAKLFWQEYMTASVTFA